MGDGAGQEEGLEGRAKEPWRHVGLDMGSGGWNYPLGAMCGEPGPQRGWSQCLWSLRDWGRCWPGAYPVPAFWSQG